MKNKTAKDAMLTIDKAFMISTNAKLNYETLSHVSGQCTINLTLTSIKYFILVEIFDI